MKKEKYHIERVKKGNPITLQQVKEIETDILREFVKFCEENNLRYFLAGGTLIGAVRHQGFVPWDDDLDVSMPRPDYERFHELCQGKLGKYEVRSIYYTPDIHCRPFIRVVEPNYVTRVKVDQVFLPPWLDVHALDGLPTDEEESLKHFKKASYYKKRSNYARSPIYLTKNVLKKIAKYVYFFPYRMRGANYYAEKLLELAAKYDFENSEYIAAFVAGYGKKERMPKYYFTDGERKLRFEGIEASVPPHYDKVLTHMYGNYMKLPPVKKRVSHIVGAWENLLEREKR